MWTSSITKRGLPSRIECGVFLMNMLGVRSPNKRWFQAGAHMTCYGQMQIFHRLEHLAYSASQFIL